MLEQRGIDWGERMRNYHLAVPEGLSEPAPLVFVLHGGGGTGPLIARITGFDAWCLENGFVGCFPDGIDKNWNDGRDLPDRTASKENVDDVGFIYAMIDALSAAGIADPARVYLVGASNGAMLAYRCALERPEGIAAVAGVMGLMHEPFSLEHQPMQPMPILFMLGTDDPICPFDGGVLKVQREEVGHVMSAEASVHYWIQANGCSAIADETIIADKSDDQPMRVRREIYAGGENDSEVVLYRVEGGGHTWPGGEQYAPEWLIGPTCQAFNATGHIGSFLVRHSV